jgi:hypothetical protein
MFPPLERCIEHSCNCPKPCYHVYKDFLYSVYPLSSKQKKNLCLFWVLDFHIHLNRGDAGCVLLRHKYKPFAGDFWSSIILHFDMFDI